MNISNKTARSGLAVLAFTFALPAIAGVYNPDEDKVNVTPMELAGIRNMRFCEMLPMGPDQTQAYNTFGSEDGCPAGRQNPSFRLSRPSVRRIL